MASDSPSKVALTPGEFAALFGKSQTWGYRQLYAGKVKAITEYGRTMIPASEVERILGDAGRYLGAGTTTEKAAASSAKKPTQRSHRKNQWREAIRKRRAENGGGKQRGKAGAKDFSMMGLREAALRKLYRQR